MEVAGGVLAAGLALGIGAASVADLSGAMLLLILGRGIRKTGATNLVGPWLGITLALGAIAFRWGAPSLEAIQGAQGVLGLGAGEVFSVAGSVFAGLGGLLALSALVGPLPDDLEERILFLATPLAGGSILAAVFLGQAGRDVLVLPLGLLVGAIAVGIAILLEKRAELLAEVFGYVGPAIAGLGAMMVAIRL